MEKGKTIVLFDTALFTSNKGDEIILDSVKEGLREILESGSVLRLATHTKNLSPMQIWHPTWKTTAFINADLKLIAGTNLLTKRIEPRKINNPWELHNYNRDLYRGCVLVGVGANRVKAAPNRHTLKLYRYILSDQYVHSVRDNDTKDFVENVIGKRAINTGCPTLWGLTPERCAAIPKKKADTCIFSVSGFPQQKNPEHDQIMLDILEDSYEKLYAWIQTELDEGYLDSLKLKRPVERIFSMAEFARLAKAGNVEYVGTRLHGGVFAMQQGIRSLVISIDSRARGFHESNNLPILERKEIAASLSDRLHAEWPTEIRLDQEAIRQFLSQFD